MAERTLHSFMPGSILGIDIGTTSAKIVQLRKDASGPVLETYGVIDLSSYADLAEGERVKLRPERSGAALLDLLSAVAGNARAGGMAVQLSSTFTALLDTPRRDREQMARIIPLEAKRLVPVPLDNVSLDWRVLDKPPEERPFEQAESGASLVPQTQKVLLIAVRNEALDECRAVADSAHLSILLYEVEMFSAARATKKLPGESVLLIDLGASATKVYALDEHGEPTLAHLIDKGGAAISRLILESGLSHFSEAETLKRKEGVEGSTQAAGIAAKELTGVFEEALRLVRDYDALGKTRIRRAVLTGGGALMPGIAALAHQTLGLEVELASPLLSVQGPEILADRLADVGPLYAVATGLALRALQ